MRSLCLLLILFSFAANACPPEPFVAVPPYAVNVAGVPVSEGLWSDGAGCELPFTAQKTGDKSRSFDFSGDKPFINAGTGVSDYMTWLVWNPAKKIGQNIGTNCILNSGWNIRIKKFEDTTMIRALKDDGPVAGKCREALNSFRISNRQHILVELNVQFGADNNTDGIDNNWHINPLNKSGVDPSPILFWQLHSDAFTNPSISAIEETDQLDASKLQIRFIAKNSNIDNDGIRSIGIAHGLERHTQIEITIDAQLDERDQKEGGMGYTKIFVNNVLIGRDIGGNIIKGQYKNYITPMTVYAFNEVTCAQNRTIFFRANKFYQSN